MKHIVFLPGLGCDHRLFSYQEDKLKGEYTTKVIVCNTENRMADHVKFVFDNSPEKFILVGHSFGGWIAQWMAIEAPERISNLILIGTGTGKLTPNLKNIFIEMKEFFERNQASTFFEKIRSLTMHEKRKNDEPLHELIKNMQSNFSKEQLLNQVNTDLEARDTSEYLKNISTKTLLIHGKQDSFYEKDMLLLRSQIPNNYYVEIDDCGHMVPIEQEVVLTHIIKLWLEGVNNSLTT